MSQTFNKPLWPGWFARLLCRKFGHFPAHSRWLCVRCGDLLDERDPIHSIALERFPQLFVPHPESSKQEEQ